MEFLILGPLEVWDEHIEVPVGGRKPRALLTMLLLHANEVVPADLLIDALWGIDPPGGAAAALRLNVSRVRSALPRAVLTTKSPGYVLRVRPDELDLTRFESLVDDGRRLLASGLAAEAAQGLREAMALWRGQPLSDLADESFALAAATRLKEIRLAAVELRIDADLALGRHGELVPELTALVREHPRRERFRVGLMTALYRSNRQAEALEVYQDARRVLVDELAIEPSHALQELERAILRQDHSLDLRLVPPADVHVDRKRSILVAVQDQSCLQPLLAVAEPLVRHPSRALVLAHIVSDGGELRTASQWLERCRSALVSRGIVARTAAFTSSSPGADLVRLCAELDVELLLTDAPDDLLVEGVPNQSLAAVLTDATCDVAILVPRSSGPIGPVIVPFGGADNEWSAVELGAWLALAVDAPLRLAGAEAVPESGRRDASRLLSHASLAVQEVLGVAAEPLLVRPGADGMLVASRDAGLLLVGLSARWRVEGLGPARLELARHATPPTLLVRRGLRPGGLAPPSALTRFTWSIRP